MTSKELGERQSWPLEQKIDHTLATIDAFVGRLGGLDKVYLSFSGGKDSTVLLHLARVIFPDILAVFCNTGNEYPEIIQFVRQTQLGGGGKFKDYSTQNDSSPSMGAIWLPSHIERNEREDPPHQTQS